jgi:hypothetical protein
MKRQAKPFNPHTHFAGKITRCWISLVPLKIVCVCIVVTRRGIEMFFEKFLEKFFVDPNFVIPPLYNG